MPYLPITDTNFQLPLLLTYYCSYDMFMTCPLSVHVLSSALYESCNAILQYMRQVALPSQHISHHSSQWAVGSGILSYLIVYYDFNFFHSK
jgi:hypothetical protein